MEIFQDSTFTALVAIILCFLVAKIVSFAVSDSVDDHNNSSVCTDVTKEVSLNRGLRVEATKGLKKLKFVDDVKVGSVDRYGSENGSESLVLSGDSESKNEDEDTSKRVDQTEKMGINFGSAINNSEKQCLDIIEMNDVDAQNKEFEITGIIFEKDGGDDKMDMVLGEINEMLVENDGGDYKMDMVLGEKGLTVEDRKNDIVMECDDMINGQKQENGVVGFGENEGLSGVDAVDVVKPSSDDGVLVIDDDDWEGIERSELEKVFAEAVNFVEYGGKGREKDVDWWAKLDGDKKTQLYGLHKVAVEGPCCEPQPMALMMLSRAKWNAWQKLGNMNPEEAMEEYIRILSESVPHWMPGYSADTDTDTRGSFEFEPDTNPEPILSSVSECGRKSEMNATDIGDSNISPSYVENVTNDSVKE